MNAVNHVGRWLLKVLLYPLPLGRWFGVPVRMLFCWLVFPGGLFVWMVTEGLFGPGKTLLLAICFCLSLLAHEFAHVLVARFFGCRTNKVILFSFGCVAFLEDEPDAAAEFLVALAGPVMSAVLAGILVAVLLATETGLHHAVQFHPFICFLLLVNTGFACFNLLPCFPMDGGRMLRSVLAMGIGWLRPGGASQAKSLATWIAVRCVGIPVAVGAVIYTTLVSHYWHHLLLFAGIIWAGETEYRALRKQARASSRGTSLVFLPNHHRLWARLSTLPRRVTSLARQPSPA